MKRTVLSCGDYLNVKCIGFCSVPSSLLVGGSWLWGGGFSTPREVCITLARCAWWIPLPSCRNHTFQEIGDVLVVILQLLKVSRDPLSKGNRKCTLRYLGVLKKRGIRSLRGAYILKHHSGNRNKEVGNPVSRWGESYKIAFIASYNPVQRETYIRV